MPYNGISIAKKEARPWTRSNGLTSSIMRISTCCTGSAGVSCRRKTTRCWTSCRRYFLTAWNKRVQLMRHPNPGGWLVEALKFRVMSARTRSQRKSLREAYSLDEEDSPAPVAEKELSPEQSAILAGHMRKLRELLGQENAEIFLAWAVEGRSAAEIAAAHDLTTSCVWMRISRSRKKLAAHPELFYIFLAMLTGFSSHSL